MALASPTLTLINCGGDPYIQPPLPALRSARTKVGKTLPLGVHIEPTGKVVRIVTDGKHDQELDKPTTTIGVRSMHNPQQKRHGQMRRGIPRSQMVEAGAELIHCFVALLRYGRPQLPQVARRVDRRPPAMLRFGPGDIVDPRVDIVSRHGWDSRWWV
ncbi:hypothetical protein GCM10009839_22460 [Catenulispora yoronensis]|uniref:Uncharacterized protein n=1 Tax=Catenulispora yoronensis TaxID=450799 RepID=A0ABP5FF13_9ACTN